MSSKKKILLVDDSQTILLMERMVLGTGEWDLLTARDGEEAVATAVAEKPDLILLDVVMPKMDGFEACRRIRGKESTSGIPIIMVTSRGEPQNVETGYEAGCTDYITKPIDGQELLSKVRSVIGGG